MSFSGTNGDSQFERESRAARNILLDETLTPGETNFADVLEKMLWLHKQLTLDHQSRPGRRAIDPSFQYAAALESLGIPDSPQSFETAAASSLEAFDGCIRWHHPHALFNITPSPLLDTVALGALTLLYNPNALWDLTSGKFLLLEKHVCHFLASMLGWGSSSGGLFTFGGKATLMYAVKSGLNRCEPETVRDGMIGSYRVFASQNAHFSIESVCNYLGLGHRACMRISTGPGNRIDVTALEESLRSCVDRGEKPACVILSGGGTMNLSIDPVVAVRDMVEHLREEKGLTYTPHIHVDSVISWAWLTFGTALDTELADSLPPELSSKIRQTIDSVQEFGAADSFACDFHKTGLSPYSSSCFVTRHGHELISLDHEAGMQQSPEVSYGDICNFDRTFENSRNCLGIMSAHQVLHRLGRRGLQFYLAQLLMSAQMLREEISSAHRDVMEVLNSGSLGFEVVVYFDLLGGGLSFSDVEADPVLRQKYAALANQFRDWLVNSQYCADSGTPFIGYVVKYADDNHRLALPAFLLYSTSVHVGCDEVVDILARLRRAIEAFRADGGLGSQSIDWSRRPPPPK